MKFKPICYSILMFLVTGIWNQAFANSGASFLKIGVGARASGIGSAYTAIADDVTALYWNPAGLAQMRKKEIAATHTELFADTRYDFIGYAMPLGSVIARTVANSDRAKQSDQIATSGRQGDLPRDDKRLVFGVGATYLSQGSIEGRSENRTQTSDFSANDLAVTLGLARSGPALPLITRKASGSQGTRSSAEGAYRLPLSLGINAKLIRSQIADISATGFAFDIGATLPLYHVTTLPLSVGFALQNLGPKMSFINETYSLPLTLAGGIGYQVLQSLLISSDLKYQPYDSQTTFSLGTEFSPVSMLSLRAGYLLGADGRFQISDGRTASSSIQYPASSIWSFGLGLKIGPSTLDYSFNPAAELGTTQRLSLSVKF